MVEPKQNRYLFQQDVRKLLLFFGIFKHGEVLFKIRIFEVLDIALGVFEPTGKKSIRFFHGSLASLFYLVFGVLVLLDV